MININYRDPRPIYEQVKDNFRQLIISGALPDGLDILHSSSMGRLQQLVLRGNADEIRERLAAANPLFVDTVPLTLEEIFIYELGGADDEIKDIVL